MLLTDYSLRIVGASLLRRLKSAVEEAKVQRSDYEDFKQSFSEMTVTEMDRRMAEWEKDPDKAENPFIENIPRTVSQ